MALTRKTVTSKITSSGGCRLWHPEGMSTTKSHTTNSATELHSFNSIYIQRMVRNMNAVLNPFLKLRNLNCVSYSSFIFEKDAANILTTAWDLFMHSLIYLYINLFIDNPHIQLRFPQITLALSHSELQKVKNHWCYIATISAALSARLSPAINKHSLYCEITSSLNIQVTNFESSQKTAW